MNPIRTSQTFGDVVIAVRSIFMTLYPRLTITDPRHRAFIDATTSLHHIHSMIHPFEYLAVSGHSTYPFYLTAVVVSVCTTPPSVHTTTYMPLETGVPCPSTYVHTVRYASSDVTSSHSVATVPPLTAMICSFNGVGSLEALFTMISSPCVLRTDVRAKVVNALFCDEPVSVMSPDGFVTPCRVVLASGYGQRTSTESIVALPRPI